MPGDASEGSQAKLPKGTEGARPTREERGTGVGTSSTATTGVTSESPKPQPPTWKGESVVLDETVFNSLRGLMEDAHDQVHFLRFKKQKVLDRDTQLAVPEYHYGYLQVNVGYVAPRRLFFWEMLREIVMSGEEVLIAFPSARSTDVPVTLHKWDRKTQRIVSTDVTDWLREHGLTLASKRLTVAIHGSLVPEHRKGTLTSRSETFSVIYLAKGEITNRGIAHEVFGHLYVAIRKLPYGHDDDLTDKGILGVDGRPFSGSVRDFIYKQVVPAHDRVRR
jgi:hypothetical protein